MIIRSLFYILLIFSILTSTSYSLKANSSIYESEKNTQLNIKKAKLLENYVYSLKENILNIKGKYNIVNDNNIDKIENELSIMINNLKKIQSVKIEKEISEKVTNEIIKRLKVITPRLKNALKIKKNTLEISNIETKIKYSKIADLLSDKIEKIVVSLYVPIKNKNNYSLKDSKVIKHLKALLIERNKLENFKNEKYNTEIQMKKKLIIILRDIKSEISWLKKILK